MHREQLLLPKSAALASAKAALLPRTGGAIAGLGRAARGVRRRALPALLAVLAGLWALPARAVEVRLLRPTPDRIEIVGPNWVLRYGSIEHYQALLVMVSASRAYFSHGHWLRLIDTEKGVVIGRWRFPATISEITQEKEGQRVRVTMLHNPGTKEFKLTEDFDPAAPEISYWPTEDMRLHRLPRVERGALAPKTTKEARAAKSPEARAELAALEEAVRRDPLSPWLRVLLGQQLLDMNDPRAEQVLRDAVTAGPADFTELFPLYSHLYSLRMKGPARAALERGLRDFYARGHDPRLYVALLDRLVLGLYGIVEMKPDEDERREIIENLYRIAPYIEAGELAWALHAEHFRQAGQTELADLWAARAQDAAEHSSHLLNIRYLARVDDLWVAVLASGAAIFIFVVAQLLRYRPQRRLDAAARKSQANSRQFVTWLTAGCAYWSRRERLAFFVLVCAGWYATGTLVGREVTMLRYFGLPLGFASGSMAGPSSLWVIENRFPRTPAERDFLRAYSLQQSNQPQRAEPIYRSVPQFAESWNNLGVILKNAGKEDEAKKAFARALELDPSLYEANFNLGRPVNNFWVEQHQKYLPGQPMIAAPRRDLLLRAFERGSNATRRLRALAGPFNEWGTWQQIGSIFGRSVPEDLLQTAVVLASLLHIPAMLLAIAALFVVASREVTQGPPRGFFLAELALPGLAPSWSLAGGVALAAWLGYVYAAVTTLKFQTARVFLSALLPSTSKNFAISEKFSEEMIHRLLGPGWMWILPPLMAIFALNLFLVFRQRRLEQGN
jgi:tetratricopeptide (TPR) repeat protein